ncbi:ankyrin repeat domain-containing protein [Sphingosinicella sp. BN140058]|uniref:ankyrin repeat domain-containing protein n=1 Tax=Sphingosinicella sp. BN140058 TaxID=1892855 RepID=UPI0010120F68|nr:ankyrin repeat domain-containing protein [Sphingosinicella sp. BN140058]QAY75557.1 ankyrin repeat domain-containing protein [Sphingosinicella sp. BN140058]
MATEPSCFTKRPSVVLPDRNLVLSNVSNGASGRALAEAMLDGRVEDAQAMLRRDPRLIGTIVTHDPRMPQAPTGQYGDLLTLAVSRCDADGIAMLLGAGMPADGTLPGNALSLAVLADGPELAERLLQAGASPDPQHLPQGEDPMRAAITFSNIGAVMTLLRHGADPRWADPLGIDRVRLALDAEQADIAELLVEKGGTLWSVAEDGSMAAHELAAEPVIFTSAEMQAARARLLDRARKSPIGWPPPERAHVRQMVVTGAWPTAAMARAGMTVAPQILERMRQDRAN